MAAVALGVDAGTQGVKVVLVEAGGAVRGRAAEEYAIDTPATGWAEQWPQVWWDAACRAVRRALAESGLGPSDVAVVGLSGQMHGIVLLDGHGQPVRPAVLWADSRAVEETAELRRRFPEIERRASNPIMASFSAPKLLWLARHEPETWRRVRRVLLPKDAVRLRMTGEAATDPSDASGTLLFDLHQGRWMEDVIQALGLDPGRFPPVRGSGEVAGALTHEAAEALGLRPGTPVITGGADMPMGALGAGLAGPATAAVLLGTAGQVLLDVERPEPRALGRAYYFAHVLPGRYLAMGALLSAGLSLRWLKQLLDGRSYGELDQLAAAEPPGARGLLFLPYLAGTGTPHFDAVARAALVGMGMEHGRAAVARAVLEGVALGLRESLETAALATAGVVEIRAGGGGARSRLWLQILADVLGRRVVPLAFADSSALGAALLAGAGVGLFASVEEAQRACVATGSPVSPEAGAVSHYQQVYEVYREAYRALEQVYAHLGRMRR
ncbi:MAG: xylulokinase [Limnochordaceae bacterium]|nr:xylulokinase [Limnochordaceae bacterium]